MTSSAISYPTLKGLAQSNSSFVKVSLPELNKNLSLNHRSCASKTESEITVKRKEETSYTKEFKSDDSGSIDGDKHIGDHHKHIQERRACDKERSAEPKHEVEKSKQYASEENNLIEGTSDAIATVQQENGLVLSLLRPESIQNLITKHKNAAIIINNTFINRSAKEQNEFWAALSPNFCSANIGFVSDELLPSFKEHGDNDNYDTLAKHHTDLITKPIAHPDTQMNPSVVLPTVDCVKNSMSPEESVPLWSICTAILWIILILFWFLLYLKVLNVFSPFPEVISKPSNYEWCLMIIRKLVLFVSKLCKF